MKNMKHGRCLAAAGILGAAALCFWNSGMTDGLAGGASARVTAAGKTVAEMAGPEILVKSFAGPGGISCEDPYMAYQWALENAGDLKLVPSRTSASRPLGQQGDKSISGDGELRATAGIDIHVAPAWEMYEKYGDKKPVIVALIDTGVDFTHPELSGAIWVNEDDIAGDGIDNDGNGYVDDTYGWNFYDNSPQVFTGTDDHHGTHSAGTIAAARNGVGTVGICDPAYVKIMVIKTLGTATGIGTAGNVTKAIQYAQANGADICNLSFGTTKYSEDLYQTMKNSGMLFVVAAGNGDASGLGYDIDARPVYPASFDLENIISVANLQFDGRLDAASNYGMISVDLAAPGNYILSTSPGGGYDYMSGTSMAAPMVSGAAALLSSFAPELTAEEIRACILNSARPLAVLQGKMATGGMLDVGAAMELADRLRREGNVKH
ncbi:MAG: S8 family peptidase [Clostridium sp.]|jgi:subtilisin family serine protease